MYVLRVKARTKATGIVPKRYKGKGTVFKIGNRKCIATITKVDKNELVGEKVLSLFTSSSYLRNQ
jgi:hypothetical protein